ncbi:MAG: glycosyltransferase family 4 protein, partial [Actinomycetota bacterium]
SRRCPEALRRTVRGRAPRGPIAAGDSLSYRYLSGPLKGFASAIDHRVAVSKDAAELVSRYLGGEYEILPNGVELDRFRPPVRRHDRTGGPSIFFCGRHEPRKGLEVLLQAHRELPAEVQVWVASDGPETERLRAEYADDDRVHWLGRISDDDKAERLREASVFCAPSLGGESFGVVLIEAMAAETPIVASAIDGYMNVATHDRDAVLVEPGDVVGLRNALRLVLDDGELRDRLRTAGRLRAENFSMDALAETYVVRYRQVVTAGRDPAGRGTKSGVSTGPGDLTEFLRRAWDTARAILRSTLDRGIPARVGFIDRIRRLVRRMLAR